MVHFLSEIGLHFGHRKKLAARRKVGAQRAAPLPAPLRLLRCAYGAPTMATGRLCQPGVGLR